jgi:hypothetical protein
MSRGVLDIVGPAWLRWALVGDVRDMTIQYVILILGFAIAGIAKGRRTVI